MHCRGKIAGVNISSASSNPGASTRVISRGFNSLTGSNQVLYVVDGVPINNSAVGSTDLNGGTDFGNRANDINPDDIEIDYIPERVFSDCSIWFPCCKWCYCDYYQKRKRSTKSG